MRLIATNALWSLYPALAGIAVGCLMPVSSFAQRGQKIEFSSPQSGVVETNLNRLGTQQPGLKQLEEDLSRPFESLNPDSSLGAVVGAPSRPLTPRPTFQSKREKELEDKRKNWAFADPDDITRRPTPETIFGLKEYDKNGEEKKAMSAVEKYLDRKQGDADEQFDNSFAKRDNGLLDPLRSIERLDPLDGVVVKSVQPFKGQFGFDVDGQTAPRSTTFSGLPISDLVKMPGGQNGRTTAEQARMDEFKQLLAPRAVSPSTGDSLAPLNPQVDPTRSLVNPAKSFDPFTSPTKQDPFNPFQNGLNAGKDFQPPIFQSPLPPTPAPKAQPPSPTFGFPTRKF